MKNILCLLLLVSSFGFAQKSGPSAYAKNFEADERLLTKSDFSLTNGRMLVSGLGCEISDHNATNKFLVSVVCQQKAFAQIGLDRINEMILFANGKVREAVPEHRNYRPSEIKMAYNPASKDWSLTNLFTTVDEFGLVQTELLALDFDAEGRFLAMKRIF